MAISSITPRADVLGIELLSQQNNLGELDFSSFKLSPMSLVGIQSIEILPTSSAKSKSLQN